MKKNSQSKLLILFTGWVLLIGSLTVSAPARADMTDYPVVKLQSLDKSTARTMTFQARVGSTVKFGPLYIKINACRKSSPLESPENSSFLQIWEVTKAKQARWIFSGWMFSSSPALSAMDHPIYDVWVLDCLEQKEAKDDGIEGVVTPDQNLTDESEARSRPDVEDIQDTEDTVSGD